MPMGRRRARPSGKRPRRGIAWLRTPALLPIFVALEVSSPAGAPPNPLHTTLGTILPAPTICRKDDASPCEGFTWGTASGKSRAELRGMKSDDAELEFSYLGPSEEVAPLASGELRRQIGLKLRARDSCNVLYVMWRIEPSSKAGLVVSVKSNPGSTKHSQCGNSGYRNLAPRKAGPVPPLLAGERHRLQARLEGGNLEVRIDGRPVWEGPIGEEAASLVGPPGLRTDNGRFVFTLRVR